MQTDSAPNTEPVAEEQPAAEPGDTPAENSAPDPDENADTFPRKYVEELRAENAKYRSAAKDTQGKADEYAKRLHTSLVAATGRLQDPSDLAYAAEHLDDTGALSAALDELLEAKPHLRARKVSGDVGQGSRGTAGDVNLLGLLKNFA